MIRLNYLLAGCGLCLLGLGPLTSAVSAQEVTFYNFNQPQGTPSDTSYNCPSAGVAQLAAPPLFCFDNVYQQPVSPAYLSDTYPLGVNPDGTNPNQAIQLTPAAQQQASSLWFAVPQQISSGFTAYFAFKITPDPASFATADGIAFVIQNSQLTNSTATTAGGSTCTSTGSGANVVGGTGGCLGYGGIDNSLAFELDTYQNTWDPVDNPANSNDNHVAIQNCGAGAPNSPDHTGNCLVQLSVAGALTRAIHSLPGATFADGNVHQVVITYSGPAEATPNLLQIFIDPVFNPSTHTPAAGAVPALSGTYNIAANLNLASGTSAYVGFTSATGAADEQHELLAWTFTPHTSVTQTQPLNPPGTPTSFPFGAHTYIVTYPLNGPSTTGFNMTVTANTIAPLFFQQLVAPGAFAGSQCQVYDETGGNCVVYSVSCTQGSVPAACPSISPNDTDPADLISVTSAFNNSTPLLTPGFLQGDPLYTQIGSITGDGQTATVTCTGECSVTTGQTVLVVGSSIAAFNGTVTVLTTPAPNVFTYASSGQASPGAPATGGYLTSNNVQNIFTSFTDALIDSGVSGKTKNFSDFVVTAITPTATTLNLSAQPSIFGQPVAVNVVATSANGNPPGAVSLTVDNGRAIVQPLIAVPGTSSSTASFTLIGLTGGSHTVTVTYPGAPPFLGATASLPITVTATPLASVSATSLNFGTLYAGGAGLQAVTLSNVGDAPLTINTPFIFDVGNGNSKEFVALNLCPRTLAAGRSCVIFVGFYAGPSYNTQTAILKIMDNAPGSPQSVHLVANVINPQASFSPSSLAFGNVPAGSPSQKAVVVSNPGGTPLTISSISIKGTNPGDFSLVNGCPALLQPGATCTLGVTFHAAATGARSAYVYVVDNAASRSQQVKLTGTGSAPVQ